MATGASNCRLVAVTASAVLFGRAARHEVGVVGCHLRVDGMASAADVVWELAGLREAGTLNVLRCIHDLLDVMPAPTKVTDLQPV